MYFIHIQLYNIGCENFSRQKSQMQSFRVEQTQQIPTPEKPEDAGTEYDRLKITAPGITRK